MQFLFSLGKQCQLPPLPYGVYSQVAIVMDGTPAFCGGITSSVVLNHCYKLEKTNKTWVQVSC